MPVSLHRPVQKVNFTTTTPSPVGGLNARDTLITMPQEDASLLRNMIVDAYGTGVRRGSQKHAINLGGEVQTLLVWMGGTSSKMWAMVTDNVTAWMTEVTTSGDYTGVAKAITGLSHAQWQQTNFANSGGQHLVAFNGADDGIWYSSSGGLTRLLLGDGIVSGTIKNIDPKVIVAVVTHQRRLWFAQKDTMVAWYLPTDQIYGIASKFDFGPLFKLGGRLVGLFTWSKNTYKGPQDQLVVVTSEGEAAVYEGTDPASASSWALVGIQTIGSPVGTNFGGNISGDLFLLTEQKLISMNLASASDTAGINSSQQVAAKIHKVFDKEITENKDEYGWQIFDYPAYNLLIVNTPTHQLVANKVTRAWSECYGFSALCWQLFRQDAFFGTATGEVYQGFWAYKDKIELDGTGGDPIPYEAQQAFTLMDAPGLNKYVSMVRPSLLSEEAPQTLVGVLFDYNISTVFGALTTEDIESAFWDEDVWDVGTWGSGLLVSQEWTTVGGIGYAVTIRLKGIATAETYWIATDWIYNVGPGL